MRLLAGGAGARRGARSLQSACRRRSAPRRARASRPAGCGGRWCALPGGLRDGGAGNDKHARKTRDAAVWREGVRERTRFVSPPRSDARSRTAYRPPSAPPPGWAERRLDQSAEPVCQRPARWSCRPGSGTDRGRAALSAAIESDPGRLESGCCPRVRRGSSTIRRVVHLDSVPDQRSRARSRRG